MRVCALYTWDIVYDGPQRQGILMVHAEAMVKTVRVEAMASIMVRAKVRDSIMVRAKARDSNGPHRGEGF